MASLFRKQSLERVSNPDALDSYIRIASPGVWLVLGALLLLIAAAVVWGLLGTVTVNRTGYLVIDSQAATLWIAEDTAEELASGSALSAAGQSGLVTSSAGAPESSSDILAEAKGTPAAVLQPDEWVCPFSASIDLPAGSYEATVTLRSYSPFQLIFGGAQAADVGNG